MLVLKDQLVLKEHRVLLVLKVHKEDLAQPEHLAL
jgi:hypothetical protein